MGIKPLREPEDAAKVARLAADMRERGWVGRPILICDEDSDAPQAYTGSHRLAAAEQAGISPEVYGLEDTDVDVDALTFNCLDDSDRMTVIQEGGDLMAITIMRAELDANDS